MVKLVFLSIIIFLLTSCTGLQINREDVQYDYLIPPSYPLSDKYRYISVDVDDLSLTRPEPKLEFEALKLKYTSNPKNAQIVVFLHLNPSYLVQRSPISRKVITYDENGKGHINYIVTNRGYIRTPYTIEVVDKLEDKLIFQTQGAGNFPIDAKPKARIEETEKTLKTEFYGQTLTARNALLGTLWENLKTHYLQDITVGFGNYQFKIVSNHEKEAVFNQAYKLLNTNNPSSAKKALNLYNELLKKYQSIPEKTEEQLAIIKYVNEGITAAAKIANSTYQSRY